jgi:curved DNA-binding protein
VGTSLAVLRAEVRKVNELAGESARTHAAVLYHRSARRRGLAMSREHMLRLLGLGPDANTDVIKRRYRELARRYHPDVNPADHRAHARFRAILAAYQHLLAPRDPGPRRAEPESGPGSSQEIPITCPLVVPLPREERTLVVPIEITLLQVIQGAQLGVALPDGRIVLVEVPPGADTGLLLRPEDGLLIEIRVKPDREYRRRGDDLLVRMRIEINEALAGTRRQLATPSGPVTVVVPRHSRRGDVVRVIGRGVPGPRGRGDLFVELAS